MLRLFVLCLCVMLFRQKMLIRPDVSADIRRANDIPLYFVKIGDVYERKDGGAPTSPLTLTPEPHQEYALFAGQDMWMDWDYRCECWDSKGFNENFLAVKAMNLLGEVNWYISPRMFQVCLGLGGFKKLQSFTIIEEASPCYYHGFNFDSSWCGTQVLLKFDEPVFLLSVSDTEANDVGNVCQWDNAMFFDYSYYYRQSHVFPLTSRVMVSSSQIEQEENYVTVFENVPIPNTEDVSNGGKLLFAADTGILATSAMPDMSSILTSGFYDPVTNTFPNTRFTALNIIEGFMTITYSAKVSELIDDPKVTFEVIYNDDGTPSYDEHRFMMAIQGLFPSNVPGLYWDIGPGTTLMDAAFSVVSPANHNGTFVYFEDAPHWKDRNSLYFVKHYVWDNSDGLMINPTRVGECNEYEDDLVWENNLNVITEWVLTNTMVRTAHFRPRDPNTNLFDNTGLFAGSLWQKVCAEYPDGKKEVIKYNSEFEYRKITDPMGIAFTKPPYLIYSYVDGQQGDASPSILSSEEEYIFIAVEKANGVGNNVMMDPNTFVLQVSITKKDNTIEIKDDVSFVVDSQPSDNRVVLKMKKFWGKQYIRKISFHLDLKADDGGSRRSGVLGIIGNAIRKVLKYVKIGSNRRSGIQVDESVSISSREYVNTDSEDDYAMKMSGSNGLKIGVFVSLLLLVLVL